MTQYSTGYLLRMVDKTMQVDESGDADFDKYMEELVQSGRNLKELSVYDMLLEYLVWANGPEWEQFLTNAKVGDVPGGA